MPMRDWRVVSTEGSQNNGNNTDAVHMQTSFIPQFLSVSIILSTPCVYLSENIIS